MTPAVRSKTFLAVVGVVLGATALAGVASLWGDREAVGDGLTRAEGVATRQQEVIDKLAEDLNETRDQLLERDIEPSAPPSEETIDDLPDVSRPTAEAVPPTDDQVEAAVFVVLEDNPELITSQVIAEVTRYLLANPPEPGEDGEDGEDGAAGVVTVEMVFAAVVSFCSGPDEPCTGEDGQDVTQAMVDAAIELFCADDACRSTVPGPIGATGATGRGLVSIDCVDGVLIATYDSGDLTQVIEGTTCQFPPGQGGKD
jgi:hypothetical protein